jgi:hypothetical protein
VCVEISARVFGWGNWEATQTSGHSVYGSRLESGTARLQTLGVVVTRYSPPLTASVCEDDGLFYLWIL